MLNEDGSASLALGSTEIGQGIHSTFAQIVAEELGIKLESIKVIAVDTDTCPLDLGAYASRQAFVTGMAVKKAAIACKNDLLKAAGEVLKQPSENLKLQDGWVLDKKTNEKLTPTSEVSMNTFYALIP